MTNLTKQDVQNVMENVKNQMLQRVASRQDLQAQNDLMRALLSNLQQNQQLLRQSEFQRVQMHRRAVALESRIVQLDQELRTLRGSLENSIARLIEQQPERIIMPVQADAAQQARQPLYNLQPTV